MNRFYIPEFVLEQTVRRLQDIGREGFEGFVVWGGRLSEDRSRLDMGAVYQPQQRSAYTEHGLLVTVTGEALHRMNRSFYEGGYLVAAQAHTHPTEAFHSPTDDDFPLVTMVGGLSVVLPNFARDGLSALRDWAWYRLISRGRWLPFAPDSLVTFVK